MVQLFKSKDEVVKAIHREIDAAEDKLLQEAKAIIAGYAVNDKAKRLMALGFKRAKVVQQDIEKFNVVHESMELAKLIEYYKVNYPFQKFITEAEMDRICKKYGLIHAPVHAYKKDVPEKNLREIEQAKPLKHQDKAGNVIWCELQRDNSFFLFSGSGGNWCGLWGSEWYRIPKRIEGKHFNSKYAADEYLRKNFGFKTTYLLDGITNCIGSRQGLFVAAPKSHFDLKALKQHGKYGHLSFSIVEPKDPIVFRYCKGGIQVLSKWGIEGEDEALTNEILN